MKKSKQILTVFLPLIKKLVMKPLTNMAQAMSPESSPRILFCGSNTTIVP